jgi:hypothetical protein
MLLYQQRDFLQTERKLNITRPAGKDNNTLRYNEHTRRERRAFAKYAQ